MSAGAITAGEAYVSVTCDNSELEAGLREASAAIMSTARRIASMEDDLTVSVGVEGVDALEKSLRRVESAVGDVAKEVKESAASATVFATGFFPAIKNAISSPSAPVGVDSLVKYKRASVCLGAARLLARRPFETENLHRARRRNNSRRRVLPLEAKTNEPTLFVASPYFTSRKRWGTVDGEAERRASTRSLN